MTYSVFVLIHHWSLRIILLLIVAPVTVHLLRLKTIPKGTKEAEAG